MILVAVALAATGCHDERDKRLAAVAVEAVRQQADQNRRMVDLQEQVATGTRRLVEADTQARREMTQLHQSVLTQQSEVGHQRDRLDEERKALAGQRQRETIWAAVIHDGAALVGCLLLLAIAALCLWPQAETAQTAELSELFLADLSSDRPLLPAPTALAALPSPDTASSGSK